MMGMKYLRTTVLCVVLLITLVMITGTAAVSSPPLPGTGMTGPNLIQGPDQNLPDLSRPLYETGILNTEQQNQGSVQKTPTVQVSSEHSTDRVIVRYKTDIMSVESDLPSMMTIANAEVGASVVQDYSSEGLTGMQVVQVKGGTVTQAVEEYKSNPNVLYAEPDYVISLPPEQSEHIEATTDDFAIAATRTPNDPEFPLLWGLQNTGQAPFYGKSGTDIKATTAWSKTTGSSGTVIAVIDTGVDYTHPDLAANIWKNPGEISGNGIDDDRNGYVDDVYGWNFASKNNNPYDDNGHGTHCAGTIAAVGNNNIGVTGVAWNAKIMPLKFLTATGNGYVSDAISAILYANRMGAHVISNSWGGTQYTQALKDAIDASPAVVVCAAGNSGLNTDSTPQYPSAYTNSNIISVAATDAKDNLAGFSNYGVSSVDLAAPGVTIRSTYKNNQYQYLSGTSMATPYVSGVAALIKSASPGMTKNQIRDRILTTVDRISSLNGKVATGGRLNAAAALGSSPSPTPTPYPTQTISPAPTLSPGTLKASFMASPVKGYKPLRVQFLDTSSGNPSAWAWNFGDGGYSYQKNPVYTYQKRGVYSVRLTISGGGKMSTINKSRFITSY
jgi:thermitase